MSDIKTNMVSESFWLKTLYLILFYVIYRLSGLLVALLMLLQWGSQLITGRVNDTVLHFSTGLVCYVKQLVAYLTQTSDDKPYPFSPWPVEVSQSVAVAVETTPVEDEAER